VKNLITLLFLGLFLHSCGNADKRLDAGEIEDQKTVISEETPEEKPKESDYSIKLKTTSEKIQSALTKINSENALFEREALEEFYSSRNYSPAWTDADDLDSFYREVKNAEKEGLSFTDYHGEKLEELTAGKKSLQGTEAASLDIYLTDAFLAYARDLWTGKLDPRELHGLWGVSRKDQNFGQLLQDSVENNEIASILEGLKPSHEVYSQLKKSLQEYKKLKKNEPIREKISEGKLIKSGEKDKRLPLITKILRDLGQLTVSENFNDSIYSEELQAAIKEFQKAKGLQVDGIIGNSTIAELNVTHKQRYKQILANLERWRWYPRDLGDHYILINIPDFKLAVVRNGVTVKEHNIIVGTRARPTPVFTDTLQYIVINPEWHIPPTIKTQDVIPKASQDPSYLRSHNMRVIGRDGETIDPSTIDWSSKEVSSYNFVQNAGPSNPLGRVKIIYPNDFLIYLHDTPAQALFSQNQRAESSGCVRVENALDLSAYVLENQEEWNQQRIEETIATGKTVQVKIDQPIQVHHFYWTAWRAVGKPVFVNDLYDLDRKIYTRLQEN